MTDMTGVLVSDTPSELLYGVAVAGGVLAASALLLLSVTFALRLLAERRAAQRARTRDRWRARLFDHALSDGAKASDLPTLTRREFPFFMELWLTLMQTLRGPPRERMVALAEQLALARPLRAWLDGFSVNRQLSAMISLGYLREHSAWTTLNRYLDDSRTVFSLTAARALVAMDAEQAAPLIVARLGRADWSVDRVAALLTDIPATRREPLLIDALDAAGESQTVRILVIMDRLHKGGQSHAIARALERFPQSDEVLSQCLRIMENRRWLPLVREHLGHGTWFVRMRAAQALGRLGGREDLPVIAPLLGDAHWWVRFRAAQTITQWPGMDRSTLDELVDSQTDAFARDILNTVLLQQGGPGNGR